MKDRRFRFKISLFTLFLAGSVQPGFSQDQTDELASAKARYFQYQESVKDITIHQQMEIDAVEGPTMQEVDRTQKNKKYRIDMRLYPTNSDHVSGSSGNTRPSFIFDGIATWTISSDSSKKETPYEESIKYQRDSDLWDFLMKNGEIVRREMVGNYDCFVVDVKDEKQLSYELWIEKGTYNLIQAESLSTDRSKVSYWNSNFRKVTEGWEIPYRTEIYLDDKLISTNIVKSVRINQGLSDDLFDFDKFQMESVSIQGG